MKSDYYDSIKLQQTYQNDKNSELKLKINQIESEVESIKLKLKESKKKCEFLLEQNNSLENIVRNKDEATRHLDAQ
eukprot:CAMPEP_0116904442 /NCGR_PEP_ID=MMETSP0467-20121206/11433_1 /TAXON_ID=283647 /ORGANISM="Mesodinium pulex, Strain SPMC105" /LENGTH=75 /DNA_ID=CAMNT_0004579111 /DNA_START=286 /DNA_END=513 /DNA_ORIENTATION=-